MSDKLRTLYPRFRKVYEEMEVKGVGLDKDFVIISRTSWDKSVKVMEKFNQARKAVYNNGIVN